MLWQFSISESGDQKNVTFILFQTNETRKDDWSIRFAVCKSSCDSFNSCETGLGFATTSKVAMSKTKWIAANHNIKSNTTNKVKSNWANYRVQFLAQVKKTPQLYRFHKMLWNSLFLNAHRILVQFFHFSHRILQLFYWNNLYLWNSW